MFKKVEAWHQNHVIILSQIGKNSHQRTAIANSKEIIILQIWDLNLNQQKLKIMEKV